jgi:hypothetical protein
MCAWQSGEIFPGIGFVFQVVGLHCEGIRRVVSGHALIDGEEVKEQVDNKGCCLISHDVFTTPATDHGY